MNKLNLEKQAQIIRVLCEGNSIRSTARITDSAINTVVKLLKDIISRYVIHSAQEFSDSQNDTLPVKCKLSYHTGGTPMLSPPDSSINRRGTSGNLYFSPAVLPF